MFPLPQKSDPLLAFIRFKTTMENQAGTRIKILHSDGGGEFLKFKPFLAKHGIIHQISCPYTAEQNGTAEQKHQHIVETWLTLMAKSLVPQKFWDHAFETAVFLINRLPSTNLKNKVPFEFLFHHPPNYTNLKVFGCECFPLLRPYNNHKLHFHSLPCVFLGYSDSHLGYKCYRIPTGHLYISRHVIFNEASFPFIKETLSTIQPTHSPISVSNPPPIIPISINLTPSSQNPPTSQPNNQQPIEPSNNDCSVSLIPQYASSEPNISVSIFVS